jgi:hypothetical protein
LAARGEIYGNPSLADWSSNHGDKINKKLKQLLQKFGNLIPGAEDIVAEEVAKLSGGKKGATPKKAKLAAVEDDGSTTPSPKKRKRVTKIESVQDEEHESDEVE